MDSGEGDLQGVWQGADRRDHQHGEGASTVQGSEELAHSIKELHPVSGTILAVEEYDYQEFLQWKSQQRGTASGPPCQSWRPRVPVDPIEIFYPDDFQAWQNFKRLQAGSKERRPRH